MNKSITTGHDIMETGVFDTPNGITIDHYLFVEPDITLPESFPSPMHNVHSLTYRY